MRSGRFMLHRDYEALRQSRADADDNSPNPKDSLETLLLVNNTKLPPVPDVMLEKTLPTSLVVPERLILKYFPHSWETSHWIINVS